MLALNLANDFITGKETVEQARKAYGDIVKDKMNVGNAEYMQKFTLARQLNLADTDINTTGLTKDVMNGGKGNKKKKPLFNKLNFWSNYL